MPKLTEDYIREKYEQEGLTQKEIAELVGVGQEIISEKMSEFGIQTRSRGPPRQPIADRFWEKVDTGDSDDCWLWQASTRQGYGQIWDAEKGSPHEAHRVAYKLEYGMIPDGKQINHHCDTPLCVNPTHLYAGDKQENMIDAMKRQNPGGAKLSANQVRDIKNKLETVSWETLAEQFDVSIHTIEHIESGKRWDYIDPEHGDSS